MVWYYYIKVLPKLVQMREAGKLLSDQESIFTMGRTDIFATIAGVSYKGETDLDKKPNGLGKATSKTGDQTFEGTFLDGNLEGIVIKTRGDAKGANIGTYYQNLDFGGFTLYDDDKGEIYNLFMLNSEC